MSTTTFDASPRIVLSKLIWVAPLAIVATIAANLIVYFVLDALFGVEWQPMFTAAGVIGSSVMYLLMATVVFAVVARFAKRPIWLYQRIALGALILSLFPILSASMGMIPDAGAAPLDTVITMVLMHVVSYAVSTLLFTRLARD